jgi:hypothetical protein
LEWSDELKAETIASFWVSDRLTPKVAVGLQPKEQVITGRDFGKGSVYQCVGVAWLWE